MLTVDEKNLCAVVWEALTERAGETWDDDRTGLWSETRPFGFGTAGAADGDGTRESRFEALCRSCENTAWSLLPRAA